MLGIIEVDEGFFGARRVKVKRGRGAYGHHRVDHSKDEFARGRVHINGIEGFWGPAKVMLSKFKGLPKHSFHLHLKETEWRYNHRHSNKHKTLRTYLRENPVS